MCRNIKTLFNFDPPVTPEEIRAASLQFVRKISPATASSFQVTLARCLPTSQNPVCGPRRSHLEGGMQEALRVHGLMRRTHAVFCECYRVVPFLHRRSNPQ